MIPGRSHSGKSTLVSALIEAGGSLLSDEFAVLDDRGRVHPYPRPIGLRQAPGATPRRCDPGHLAGRIEARPLPIGLVAVTRYAEGARWQPEMLSPGLALLELMDNTVAARAYPARSLDHLMKGLRSATALSSARGEAGVTARALLEQARKSGTATAET